METATKSARLLLNTAVVSLILMVFGSSVALTLDLSNENISTAGWSVTMGVFATAIALTDVVLIKVLQDLRKHQFLWSLVLLWGVFTLMQRTPIDGVALGSVIVSLVVIAISFAEKQTIKSKLAAMASALATMKTWHGNLVAACFGIIVSMGAVSGLTPFGWCLFLVAVVDVVFIDLIYVAKKNLIYHIGLWGGVAIWGVLTMLILRDNPAAQAFQMVAIIAALLSAVVICLSFTFFPDDEDSRR